MKQAQASQPSHANAKPLAFRKARGMNARLQRTLSRSCKLSSETFKNPDNMQGDKDHKASERDECFAYVIRKADRKAREGKARHGKQVRTRMLQAASAHSSRDNLLSMKSKPTHCIIKNRFRAACFHNG